MDFINIFNDIAENTLPLFKKYREEIKNLNIEIKNDKTLLTEADIKIQKVIIDIILKHDYNANFIAEEEEIKRLNPANKFTWVIDPIDGTRPFTEKDNYEYCCSIGVLENGKPISAMIFMPEMGINRLPLLATALNNTKEIFINGTLHNYTNDTDSNAASTTRESGSEPSNIEEYLEISGMKIKHRTTSQSIDLLRTAINISPYSDIGVGHFKIFFRQRQKIWDGVPGICFNNVVGKVSVDSEGNEVLPFSNIFLNEKEPTSPAVLVAFPADIDNVIRKTRI